MQKMNKYQCLIIKMLILFAPHVYSTNQGGDAPQHGTTTDWNPDAGACKDYVAPTFNSSDDDYASSWSKCLRSGTADADDNGVGAGASQLPSLCRRKALDEWYSCLVNYGGNSMLCSYMWGHPSGCDANGLFELKQCQGNDDIAVPLIYMLQHKSFLKPTKLLN